MAQWKLHTSYHLYSFKQYLSKQSPYNGTDLNICGGHSQELSVRRCSSANFRAEKLSERER